MPKSMVVAKAAPAAAVELLAGTRGRPPSTSPRELELVALRLFTKHGFHETTVDQIAAAAGVSGRTFFRNFGSKADVLWSAFDAEVGRLREALNAVGDEMPLIEAVRTAVIAVNRYRADDVPELRSRIDLIASVPELAASSTVHYNAWERAVIDFVARRVGQPADSLFPLAVGRATLAVCRAAYEHWASRADADLTLYLNQALRALADGFADANLLSDPPHGDPT